MGFLNPWLLLGLAGISVPIIIHLLNRFRHRRIEWAAMELLRRALVIRSRRIRIEDLILLALRCLAVILIALALARPTLTAAGAKWFGAKEQVGSVLAIDGSFSMTCKPGVGTRFDRALQTVRDLKAALNPGDPLSVVLAGNRPRVLLRGVGYDDARLERILKDTLPLPEPLNLEVTLDQLATLVRETKAPVRECYIVTDGQAVTWENVSEKTKRTLREIGSTARIFILDIPADGGDNLALTDLSLAAGSLRRGTVARFVAEIKNLGRVPQDRLTVTLLAGDKPVDQRVVDRIAPGEVSAVPLFVRLDEPGYVRLSARIAQDAVEMDNVRYAVARVRDQVRVLVVNGDPSDRPFRGETDYVMTALLPRAVSAGKPSLWAEVIPWTELSSKRFDGYDVIILANVPDVRQAQVDELSNFVLEGGGLMVFLGDKVSPTLLNARFKHGDVPLLPGEVQEPSSDGAEGRPMAIADASQPVARALGSLPQQLLAEARITRYFKLALGPDGRSILKVAGADKPLLAEKSFGRGKVLLFTSTADRAWTNLPVHPAFPILLHEAVTYLTTQSHDRPFLVGEPIIVPIPARSVQTSVVFRSPRGNELAVQVTDREGRHVAQYDQGAEPGFYEMKGDAPVPTVVAVNVDPKESDVKVLSAERLSDRLAGLPVHVLTTGEEMVPAIRESRVGRELWRMLMLAGLLVLALEAYLAHRFSRSLSMADSK